MKAVFLVLIITVFLVGCNEVETPEDNLDATVTVGEKEAPASCGNDICEDGETAYTCPDCGLLGEKPDITQKECIAHGGEVVDLDNINGCSKRSDFLGTVDELDCPCICCKA